ncbi:MAG: DNA polymerase, partial [Eubacteriales bacterium]
MNTLIIDLETFSSTNLAKSGLYRYAESPDFEILLFGYSVDYGEVQVVDLACGEKIPDDVLTALTDENIIKFAHNSSFERICLSRYLGYPIGKYIDPISWKCSMVWAATMGLPLSLDGVGLVLKLDKQKLTEGKDLVKYFCLPCSPTISNGQRIRNYPRHAPDKWVTFKKYNIRDVETEMSIQEKLAKFPVPDSVWDEYHLDQEINDRGVALDMTLVLKAISIDNRSRFELTTAMKRLTELDNPNSVQQMKLWLADNGMETDTLGKKVVAELLKTAPPELSKVLALRQQLAKSSVKKYTAMENAVCADGRARGMFMFYGANRTGRWAGRLIQMQNLPQNHLEDLAEARSLVRCGDFDALEMLYEDVPDTLSQLIRTAFVPRTGVKFIIADFSAIEARVIAWMAGEQWRQDVFTQGKDIYCMSASQMFKVPVEKHGVNGNLRQKGKIAELACIAEGSLVLTNKGLVPIEMVTTNELLWDGESWVTHEGVIYKGEREVITYEELSATPDHLVWIEGQSRPIQFGIAASCGAHLIQTGNGRVPIRLGGNYLLREALEQNNESLLCPNDVYRMWLKPMAGSREFTSGLIQRLSTVLSNATNTVMVGQTAYCGKTTMREYERSQLPQLWWTRDKLRLFECDRSGVIHDSKFWDSRSNEGNRHKWKLCSWKSALCDPSGKLYQSKALRVIAVQSGILAICSYSRCSEVVAGAQSERNYSGCRNGRVQETKELEIDKRTTRLYDIRNAGRHHRFTVSGKLVHNCGYGGSVGALKAMGALEMGLDEDELSSLVNAWRQSNPNIVKLWWDVDRAAMEAVRDRRTNTTHGITFSCQSGMLFITLPSGRRLSYVKPRIGENKFGGQCITYEGVGATKKWERLDSYGPKFVENIVQATARDILCYAMQTLRNCSIVMHCHDEIVIEADKHISFEAVCEQMGRTP